MDNLGHDLFKAAVIFDYLGWVETPNLERLAKLDETSLVDKDEGPLWDILYLQVRSHYCFTRTKLGSIYIS